MKIKISQRENSSLSRLFLSFSVVVLICVVQILLIGAPPQRFRLVGVHNNSFAIIEDSANNRQDVFDLNSSVYGEATLIGIDGDFVTLSQNGKIHKLSLKKGISISGSDLLERKKDLLRKRFPDKLYTLPGEVLASAPLPKVRDGKIIGVSFLNLPEGSLLAKAGISGTDIVTSINNQPVTSAFGALDIIRHMEGEDVTIEVERNGSKESLTL